MKNIRPNSRLMTILRFLRMERVAWSLRRLYCPVDKQALVLEVGSGGNPYSRADVLLDAYEETRERHWVPLTSDRPTVLGFVEQLPFKDKAFDFVIASHVLEHSKDPVKFLAELQRVASAGYIEVPDAFFERINPYRDHRLEITVREKKLLIRKKIASIVDEELVELYEDRAKRPVSRKLIPGNPFEFHVRYYWQGNIDYNVINSEVDVTWQAPQEKKSAKLVPGFRQRVRQRLQSVILKILSVILKKFRSKQQINLTELLQCPACHGKKLSQTNEAITCIQCGQSYAVRSGIPVMQITNDA